MTFNAKEKETAAQANYTLNYYGPVSNSQIQQRSPASSQTRLANPPGEGRAYNPKPLARNPEQAGSDSPRGRAAEA